MHAIIGSKIEFSLNERDKILDAVVGIFTKDNKFLIELRRWDETIDQGIVYLPEGHVDLDESSENALKREMLEKLGIKVKEI